jgi:alanine dehydrogenase
MGFGAVSRGAIYALQGRGFNNIHVYTRRPPHLVADQNPDVYFHGPLIDLESGVGIQREDGRRVPIIEELADADIICNGVLQNVDAPLMFVGQADVGRLKPRSIIIDISCDKGMGFCFAEPTTFDSPTFEVQNGVTYYSVDHTPTYLWSAASREISKAALPFLPTMLDGSDAWKKNPILRNAMDIENGVIVNPQIISFQKR